MQVFKLKNIGIIAFLRTENGQLGKNEKLTSLDEQRKWIISEESFLYVDSYAIQLKKEHQIKQGIPVTLSGWKSIKKSVMEKCRLRFVHR